MLLCCNLLLSLILIYILAPFLLLLLLIFIFSFPPDVPLLNILFASRFVSPHWNICLTSHEQTSVSISSLCLITKPYLSLSLSHTLFLTLSPSFPSYSLPYSLFHSYMNIPLLPITTLYPSHHIQSNPIPSYDRHYHSDHYGGLNASWRYGNIICTR